jgi:hypothetical protein
LGQTRRQWTWAPRRGRRPLMGITYLHFQSLSQSQRGDAHSGGCGLVWHIGLQRPPGATHAEGHWQGHPQVHTLLHGVGHHPGSLTQHAVVHLENQLIVHLQHQPCKGWVLLSGATRLRQAWEVGGGPHGAGRRRRHPRLWYAHVAAVGQQVDRVGNGQPGREWGRERQGAGQPGATRRKHVPTAERAAACTVPRLQ